ncbi:hypothetical protein [Listeria cornellensis]|uniref:Uncharacterized protein n=1 Tax=Listeria cornellensis FSL F6-0969 TaxID=1265820 RepID=W7C127_9LIST|nr:hypothetical protein [Listeria cornellensis]EUJ30927.1 hypothetical protein PCORN_07930 [Listeria cornellensis FSL F6-0969]
MTKISFMHQNEMDLKLRKFSDAIDSLQGLPKKESIQTAVEKKADKYIVIEPFEAACEKRLKQMDAIDNRFRKYLKGRVHVEKELWIIASIKNLIDYGYLKIEE